MSLIVSVFVNEGIIMASDSKTTYVREVDNKVMVGVHSNNTTRKTFLCPNQVGLSTCGEGSVLGAPIAGYIENFIREKIKKDTRIDDMPGMIIRHFKELVRGKSPVPNANFMLGGYQTEGNTKVQKIYKVFLENDIIESIDTRNQGAAWDGEVVVLAKLINQMHAKRPDGSMMPMPHGEILWNFFSLQDAIDFAQFAIKTTIDTMHFQNVIETVGEPIDVLLLKPDSAQWIARQELHA